MKKIRKETSLFNFRLAGQRSITSSLTSRTSDRSLVTQTGRIGNEGKVSLSDFLNKRLHKSSVLPETSKEKVSSLASHGNFSGPLQNADKKISDGVENKCHLDRSIFDKFKPAVNYTDEECISLIISEEVNSLNREQGDVLESKKRGASFDFGSEYEPVKKRVVVLGDDPKPSSSKNKVVYKKSEQLASHYNHYANGKGWWDSNMEGIDNEAVGAAEVWEGVGSTTLGGLDWH